MGGGALGTHPRVFTRSVSMKSSLPRSVNSTGFPVTPAFAKKTSSRPYRFSASSTTSLMAGSSAASNLRVWTSHSGYSEVICLSWYARYLSS